MHISKRLYLIQLTDTSDGTNVPGALVGLHGTGLGCVLLVGIAGDTTGQVHNFTSIALSE